jgi:hypothetical protein
MPIGGRAHRRVGCTHLPDDGMGVREKGLPSRREPHSSGRTHEEGCTDAELELVDLPAHRGLRDVESSGRAPDRPRLHHRHERLKLSEVNRRQIIALGLPNRTLRSAHVGENGSGVPQQDLPGAREPHPPRRTNEERRSELVFQMEDLPAHRRLSDPQIARSTANITGLGDRHEVLELSEAHPLNVPWSSPEIHGAHRSRGEIKTALDSAPISTDG